MFSFSLKLDKKNYVKYVLKNIFMVNLKLVNEIFGGEIKKCLPILYFSPPILTHNTNKIQVVVNKESKNKQIIETYVNLPFNELKKENTINCISV